MRATSTLLCRTVLGQRHLHVDSVCNACCGVQFLNIEMPQVVGNPAMLKDSLTVTDRCDQSPVIADQAARWRVRSRDVDRCAEKVDRGLLSGSLRRNVRAVSRN